MAIDGVTRWESGDAHPDLAVWSPDVAAWFPLLDNRWLLAPYQRHVAAAPGAPLEVVWQVRNVVTRLSSPGKAISLRLPLLAGEKILTSGVIVESGLVEVRLGAGEREFMWESELPLGEILGCRLTVG